MKTRKIQAVIFDMDGVILDSEPIYDSVVLSHLRELGVEGDPKIFDQMRGTTAFEFWSRLKSLFQLQQPVEILARESAAQLDEHFRSHDLITPMDGLLDFLNHVGAMGIKCGLASSSKMSRILIVLERFRIVNQFGVIVGGDQIKMGKPHPEIFLKAAEVLGYSPESCLVIEDSQNGIRAAKTAGMMCAGFRGTASNKQDLSGADFIIANFIELKEQFCSVIRH